MTDIAEWLDQLGLSKYEQAFAEAEVDLGDLTSLTDDDLREIGLPIGPRRKVRNAIDQLAGPAVRSEPQSSVERRNLTVLFVDLVGSSQLSSQLDPEDNRDVILAYQNAVSEVVQRPEFKGFVAKFMGDGALCYFGWPIAGEDDPERAVGAGLALVKEVSALRPLPGLVLSCRVGVATGNVVVGDAIGEGPSSELSVIGETANIAARLQDLAQSGQVVIAETTRRLIGDMFLLAPKGPQNLRGIKTPVPAYVVSGQTQSVTRFEIQRGAGVLPLVGRQDELSIIETAWKDAARGKGAAYLISGEAGMGKSRLMREFADRIRSDETAVLTFQCSPHRQDSSFHPVITRLKRLANFSDTDTSQAHREKLRFVSATQGETLDLFAQLLDIDVPEDSSVLTLTPAQRRRRTNDALMDWTFRVASTQSLAIIIEDLHWVDPTTLEFFQGLAAAASDKRVMVLVTSRSEFAEEFAQGNPLFHSLKLSGMPRDAEAAIIAKVAHSDTVDADVVALVASRTDGVPLFIEELTKSLIERGVLRVKNGALKLDGVHDQLSVPDTLHDILVSRLDRSKHAKRTAQIAACFGREFNVDFLGPVLDGADLQASLAVLVASDLVQPVGAPDAGNYQFKHALVCDAAYGTLLKNDRRALHQRIYDHLSQTGTIAPEILALHARGAGDAQAAIGHYVVASDMAQARPAFREATAHIQNAINLVELARKAMPEAASAMDEAEMGLQTKLGAILMISMGYGAEPAKLAFERALHLSEAFPQSELRIPIVYGLWVGDFVRGDLRRGLVFAQQALAVANQIKLPALLVTTNHMMCVTLSMMGQFAQADDHVNRALGHFSDADHRGMGESMGQELDVSAYIYKAINLTQMGHDARAKDLTETSVAIATECGHMNSICYSQAHAMYPALMSGRLEDIHRYAATLKPLCAEHGIPIWSLYSDLNVAFARVLEGEADQIAVIRDTFARLESLPARALFGVYYAKLAEVLFDLGLFADAGEQVSDAQAFFDRTGDEAAVGDVLITKALLAAQDGDYELAAVCLDDAHTFAVERGSPRVTLRARVAAYRIAKERGDRSLVEGAKQDLTALLAQTPIQDCVHLRRQAEALM